MPMVVRKNRVEVTSIHGIRENEYLVYVPREELTSDDVVAKLTPRQVRDLARKYPEYRQQATRLDARALETGDLSLTEFAELSWDKAVAVVQEATDELKLAGWFGAEQERSQGPRKTVMEAFAARGFTP